MQKQLGFQNYQGQSERNSTHYFLPKLIENRQSLQNQSEEETSNLIQNDRIITNLKTARQSFDKNSQIKNTQREQTFYYAQEQVNGSQEDLKERETFYSNENNSAIKTIDFNNFKHKGNNQANANIRKALKEVAQKRKIEADMSSYLNQGQNNLVHASTNKLRQKLKLQTKNFDIFDHTRSLNTSNVYNSMIASPRDGQTFLESQGTPGSYKYNSIRQSSTQRPQNSTSFVSMQEQQSNQAVSRKHLYQEMMEKDLTVQVGGVNLKNNLLPSLRQSHERTPTFQGKGSYNNYSNHQNSVQIQLQQIVKQTERGISKKQIAPPYQSMRNSIEREHKVYKGINIRNSLNQALLSSDGFKNEVDKMMNDATLLNGFKGVAQNNDAFIRDRYNVYQQDFEVKLNKMNTTLDSKLINFSQTIGSPSHQMSLAHGFKNHASHVEQEAQNNQSKGSANKLQMKQSQKITSMQLGEISAKKVSFIQKSSRLKLESEIELNSKDSKTSLLRLPQESKEHRVRGKYFKGTPIFTISPIAHQMDQAQLSFAQENYLRKNIPASQMQQSDDEISFNTENQFFQDEKDFSPYWQETNTDNNQSQAKMPSFLRQKSQNLIKIFKDQEFERKIRQMIQEFQFQRDEIFSEYHNQSVRSISPLLEHIQKDLEEVTVQQLTSELKIKKIFNEICKQYSIPSITEQLDQDPNLMYFIKCNKENVLALPALSRIQNKQLVLQGYPLNRGLAQAFEQYFKYNTFCIAKLALDNNGLQDAHLASILQGVNHLDDFKQLILCRNVIGSQSTEQITSRIKAQFPKHLEDLKISNCKISNSNISALLQSISMNPYLRKLSLVRAQLSESNLSLLCGILETSRHLIELDISWNGLRSATLKEFWQVLSKNRTMQYLNLSWNNLIQSTSTQEEILLIKESLQKIIKYNPNLLHLDLSYTRLSQEMLMDIGSNLRKAKSLLAIHFSGNPGVNQQVKDFLLERIHAKQNRNFQYFKETAIANINSTHSPRSTQVIDGLLRKQITQKRQIIDSTVLQESQKANTENQNLIFQRYLGHKFELPGKGQWQMLTHQDPSDSPYCCECWLCTKYIYTVIFWSKSIEYQLDDEYKQEDIENILSLTPSQEKKSDTKPIIYGGFNDWQGQEMITLQEFCYHLDPAKNSAVKTMQKLGKLKEDDEDVTQLSLKDQAFLKKTQEEINNDYKLHWKELMSKHLLYKRAQFFNHQTIENIDLKEEEIFVSIQFLRPGKQIYMIQNPSSQEDSQLYFKQRNNRRIKIQIVPEEINQPIEESESEFDSNSIDSPRFSNHHIIKCISNLREEEIPIYQKSSKQKVHQRVFKKDASVFKEWKEDTPYMITQMLEDDLKQWKCHRFIKDEQDRAGVEKLIRTNVVQLKKIFMTEVCRSSFPNISWIDFSNFCDKCKIVDKNVVLATIDRIFIATNVELEKTADNPDKALNRYEFYEILVRLAQSKFKDPGICQTYTESLQKLLDEHIFPYSNPDPWQEFRDEELWTQDVNDILEANLEGLKKVYSFYWEPRKKYMTYVDTINLMIRDSALNIIEKDANYCYGMCKMSVVLESTDAWQYKQLKFVELLELVGRIAVLKFKGSENEQLQLAKKIEYILDILLRMVEVQRKDINIQVKDESESDNEY